MGWTLRLRIEMRCRLDIRFQQTKQQSGLPSLSGGRAPVLARSLHKEGLVGLLVLHWRQLGYKNSTTWTTRRRSSGIDRLFRVHVESDVPIAEKEVGEGGGNRTR